MDAYGTLFVDSQGIITYFDTTAQQLTGIAEKEILRRHYSACIRQLGGQPDHLALALAGNNSPNSMLVQFTGGQQPVARFLCHLSTSRSSQAHAAGIRISFFKEPRDAGAASVSPTAIHDHALLSAIFNSRLEGTFTIDHEWRITSFNAAAERITGYSADEVIGKPCRDIFRSRRCKNGCHMAATLQNQQTRVHDELQVFRKNGEKIIIRVCSAPLLDAEGCQLGGLASFEDIREPRQPATPESVTVRFENIIGRSKAMQTLYTLLEDVAKSDSTVLITGESGTGKELIARAIHQNGERQSQPFIAINCNAFAESLLESELFGHEKGAFTGAIRSKPGRFELAHGGTLFLDEIGDLSPAVQIKLLRVLETRQFERVGGTRPIRVNVRILTATHHNLQMEIHRGSFREDLYYRLNVFHLHLPPLRERMEDLPLLINHFIHKLNRQFDKTISGISPAAFHQLQTYSWPGNIRSLENALEHAFVLCHEQIIQSSHLPDRLRNGTELVATSQSALPGANPFERAECMLIEKTLEKCHGRRRQTAEALGIDKSTLWRKMKKYHLL